jgi:branched-subunit amino acid ABC-type transport system permease component
MAFCAFHLAHGDPMTLGAYLTLLFNDLWVEYLDQMLLSTLCVVGFAFKFTEQVLWAGAVPQ